MPSIKETPNKYPLPPLLTVGVLATSYFLDWFLPIGWTQEQVPAFMRGTGLILILLAILLDIWSLLTFRKYGANIMPHKAASHIMMHGPFAFSRNPIYLANIMLVLGFGFTLGSRWYLFGAALLFLLLTKFAINREEQHLEENFPAEWEHYRLRVRRWL